MSDPSGPRRRADLSVPQGWEWRYAGELFFRRTERGLAGLPTVALTMNAGLILRDTAARRVDTKLRPENHSLIRAGDIAYNTMRMWQGVLGRADCDAIISPAYIVLTPQDGIISVFAEQLLSSETAVGDFKRFSYGVVDDRLRLYYRDFLRIRFAIPLEVAEQRRISEVLFALDKTIAQTDALIRKYKQINTGLIQDVFTRGIIADGSLRPAASEAPELYKHSHLGSIPNEWCVAELSTLAEIVSGITLGAQGRIVDGIEVPYLRVANVQDGYFDLSELKTITVSPAQFEKLNLRYGDVMMNEGGDFDKLGRGSVWQDQVSPCIHQNHVFRVRPDARLRSKFLAYWSQSESGRQYFLMSSKQSTNLASINSSQLKRFPVPMPSLREQQGIESIVDAVVEKIGVLQADVQKLRLLKQGLMHDLLMGHVRVPRVESAAHP